MLFQAGGKLTCKDCGRSSPPNRKPAEAQGWVVIATDKEDGLAVGPIWHRWEQLASLLDEMGRVWPHSKEWPVALDSSGICTARSSQKAIAGSSVSPGSLQLSQRSVCTLWSRGENSRPRARMNPILFLSEIHVFDFSWVNSPEAWISLITLAALEIVLGIDNIVFISILVDKLPEEQRARGRFIGLTLAMVTRILLLLSITWVMQLTKPIFSVSEYELTGKDLILLLGGLFLLAKSTHEIHHKIEGDVEGDLKQKAAGASFAAIMVQVALLDIVFSLDSVITAVGMAQHIMVMVIAVMVAVGFMMVFAGMVNGFISRHPTVKMLALSFLLLIGTTLVAEGLHFHFPKGYVYFAMAFSVLVEMLNLKVAGKKKAA